MFMLSGTGRLMISLNNFSPNSILLSHSEYSSGLRLVPPKLGAVGYKRTDAHGRTALVLVGQPDTGVKEPIHLVAEPCLGSVLAAQGKSLRAAPPWDGSGQASLLTRGNGGSGRECVPLGHDKAIIIQQAGRSCRKGAFG